MPAQYPNDLFPFLLQATKDVLAMAALEIDLRCPLSAD